MIVERSMDPQWLSNAYLVADRSGGTAVFIDSGAPIGVAATSELRTSSRFDDVATLERATQALIGLGYKKRQARDLVKQARAQLSAEADIPTIVKTVLAISRSQESGPSDARADATQALVQLGYPRPVAAAAVAAACAQLSTDDLPTLVKQALRHCSSS